MKFVLSLFFMSCVSSNNSYSKRIISSSQGQEAGSPTSNPPGSSTSTLANISPDEQELFNFLNKYNSPEERDGKEIISSLNDLEKITYLKLINKGLEKLPMRIDLLSNLKIINLYWNKLTSLPVSIGGLIYLEELDLRFNEIETPTFLRNHVNFKKFKLQAPTQ